MTDIPATSPLDEAKPDSLDDLFNKDPLNLTQQDRTRVIEYLRHARTTFLKEDAAKVKKSDKGKAAPAAAKVALDTTLTIGDLDLDI